MGLFSHTFRAFLAMSKKRPWEPLLIVLAIIVANAGLVTVLLINKGAEQGELVSKQSTLFSNAVVVAKKGEVFTKRDYAHLRRVGYTQLVAFSQQDVSVKCPHSDAQNASRSVSTPPPTALSLIGIDSQALLSLADSELENGVKGAWVTLGASRSRSASTGSATARSIATIVHPTLADVLNCNTFEVTPYAHSKRDPIKPTTVSLIQQPTQQHAIGTSSVAPRDSLIVALSDFYTQGRTLKNTPLSGAVLMMALNDADTQRLISHLPEHLTLQRPPALTNTGSLPDSFKLNLWAMGILMSVVSLFIILNALNLMYRTRLPNIVRLRQLGIPPRTISISLLCELFLYCVIGCAIGLVIGFNGAVLLSPILSSTFSSLFNSLFVTPNVALLSLFFQSVLVTFLALAAFSLIPAKQTKHALNKQSTTLHSMPAVSKVLIGTALSLVTFYVGVRLVSSTLEALLFIGYVLVISCILIIFWLPLLTALIERITPKNRPILHYIAASTNGLSHKTKLAISAFFIALTANVGMNVMTDSFREATESWLSQRLDAPAYLYTERTVEALQLPNDITAVPVYRRRAEANIGDVATTIRLRSFLESESAQRTLVLQDAVSNSAQRFARGKGVYINQQFAFKYKVTPGEIITLTPIDNPSSDNTSSDNTRAVFNAIKQQQWEVLGIYPDYGNIHAQALLPQRLFNAPSTFSGVVSLSGNVTPHHAMLNKQGTLYTRDALLRLSMDTFDKTFVLTHGLNITTLLVAGLAFAVSLSMLALGNQSQLSVLGALGVSAARIKAALFAQYLSLCIITTLLAIPFGLFLAWAFITLVNRYAFHWVYPLVLDVSVIANSALFGVGTVLVILLLPLGRIKQKVDLRQEW
jgi:putative ABC transport system permease protein